MKIFIYPSLAIASALLYLLLRGRSNPSLEIPAKILSSQPDSGRRDHVRVTFDLKAFLSLFVLTFAVLAVQTNFNPLFSLITKRYGFNRLEFGQPVDPTVVLGSQVPSCEGRGNFIEIPTIEVSAPIVEGEDDQIALEEGAWLVPQSAKPGIGGNTILTGHRWTLEENQPYGDLFFRLPELSPGDYINICYNGEGLRYKIIKTEVVGMGEIEILNPQDTGETTEKEKNFVTLYTCHPLGTADKRFVAIGEEL